MDVGNGQVYITGRNSNTMNKKIYGIAGLGLMGGSFAKAIRAKVLNVPHSAGKIFALDKNETALQMARDEKIIDQYFTNDNADKMLAQCDVVFICLYPKSTIDFLIKNKNNFKKGSIVTDISGVKTEIINNLHKFCCADFDYICAHPMAGSEKEGLDHARYDLFENRNYILMPIESNKKDNLIFFKNLIIKFGIIRITETSPEDHDKKIAFTSQLCHVIASALVDSACDTQITTFGGGSFEDLTRIAMINAPLWTDLFLGNKNELTDHIKKFEDSLYKIKNLIVNNDQEQLCRLLQNVREKRIAMSNI
ncbi:MAG: prephenate dehydrogenase [Termitinemataceae bacterium]|nr:MAG: prephenate dehydrogenase [Termitinemataceae bacterium]